jgi:hypothetical protein
VHLAGFCAPELRLGPAGQLNKPLFSHKSQRRLSFMALQKRYAGGPHLKKSAGPELRKSPGWSPTQEIAWSSAEEILQPRATRVGCCRRILGSATRSTRSHTRFDLCIFSHSRVTAARCAVEQATYSFFQGCNLLKVYAEQVLQAHVRHRSGVFWA